MQKQITPDFPLPYLPEQHPPQKERKRYAFLILAFVAIGLLLVLAAAAYLWKSRSAGSNGPAARSITYYYRDGTTVLWQGSRLAEANSPTFIHAVADELLAKYGQAAMRKEGEWKIVTTLDRSLQQVAKQQVEAQRQQMTKQRVIDAALIAQDATTGQIVSWVGGVEDRLLTTGRDRLTSLTQPGTLALPLVYTAYLDNNTNVGADTVVQDTQEPLPGYPCVPSSDNCLQNLDRKYLGQMTLRQALGMMRLVPAEKAALSVIPNDSSAGGIDSLDKTVKTIEAMMENASGYSCFLAGTDVSNLNSSTRLSGEDRCYGAAMLGDGVYATPKDLIQAYATLSNGGKRLPQTTYIRLEFNGELLDEWKRGDGTQVVTESSAHTISNILSDADASYLTTKSWFRLHDAKVSVAQGFIQDGSAAGSIQFSSKYTVGFWAFGESRGIVGFPDLLTLPAASGWLETALLDD